MFGLAELIQKYYEDEDGKGVDQDDANRLAELVEALNNWILKGGFLPKAWREANEGFNHNK